MSNLKPQDSFGRFVLKIIDLQKVDHTIRKHQWRNYGGGGARGARAPPPPPKSAGKKKGESDSRHTHPHTHTHTWVSIPGGGGYIPPPNILGVGVACIIIPPIFHGWMSYYTEKISEVPTNIMKEIAGF